MTTPKITEVLDLPLSTVSLWLKRIGLGKRSRLEPLEPANRYERRHPGELVHVTSNRSGRIGNPGQDTGSSDIARASYARRIDGKLRQLTGYEYLHVIIDDHSRLAYAEIEQPR